MARKLIGLLPKIRLAEKGADFGRRHPEPQRTSAHMRRYSKNQVYHHHSPLHRYSPIPRSLNAPRRLRPSLPVRQEERSTRATTIASPAGPPPLLHHRIELVIVTRGIDEEAVDGRVRQVRVGLLGSVAREPQTVAPESVALLQKSNALSSQK